MAYLDFRVRWQGNEEDTAKEILSHMLLTPIKYDFPNVVLITGKSGNGKSLSVLKFLEFLFEAKKLNLEDYVKDIVVMNPLQYFEKLDAILYEKHLKKVFCLQLDDARMVVGAENWASFINQAISHVNSVSRSIKPLLLVIITQSIKDIDPKARRTIDWEFKCKRTRYDHVKLTPYRYWIDDKDPERPRLRKRRVVGMVDEDETANKLLPVIKVKKLKNEKILADYQKLMLEGKTDFLKNLMLTTVEKIKKDMYSGDMTRVNEMYEYFNNNPDALKEYGVFKRRKWRLTSEGLKILKFGKSEKREFEKIINSGIDSKSDIDG